MTRDRVSNSSVVEVLNQLAQEMSRRVEKHGPGAFVGPHEAMGILTEEFREAEDALRANDPDNWQEEMYDIAAACVFEIASQRTRASLRNEE